MAKSYLLTPEGKILNRDNLSEENPLNVISIIGKNNQNPSEQLTNPIITTKFFPDIFSDVNNSDSKKYILGETNELVNTSFNFIKKENNNFKVKSENEFEKVKYYKSYNSIFDLDIENTDNTGIQIFANELDFYGFSTEFLRNPIEAVEDTILRLLTIVDILIASAIPIATISLLQFLLQTKIVEFENIDKKQNSINFINQYGQNLELGKYITYSLLDTTSNNFFIKILEKTLNSFERLMNFPKFKLISYELNIFKNAFIYFTFGYISYLIPGFKIKIPNSLKLDEILTFLLNLFTTTLTSNSSRHPYNLLIRKIIRNNYFLKTTLDNNAIKTTSNGEEVFSYSYIRQLSILGSFFFRFIGERVAIGEKLFKIDNPTTFENNAIDVFGKSRLREKITSEELEKNDFKKNTQITSFRYLPEVSSISGKNYNVFDLMKENTGKIYDTSIPKLKRLPKENVQRIENSINSEYMPFSIHDLRTNEVFSFHAFINNVSDSFSPDFTTSTGIGRMDPVKIYNSTSRSISVDFWLISTSAEDHDEMWYYINRLVTCIYPQWSRPDITNIQNSNKANIKFANPFTQIPVAPPMIRLRIGDLIKSNYSRKNIIKQFGIENTDLILHPLFRDPFNYPNDKMKDLEYFTNFLKDHGFGILDLNTFYTIKNKNFNTTKDLKLFELNRPDSFYSKFEGTEGNYVLQNEKTNTISLDNEAGTIDYQKIRNLKFGNREYDFDQIMKFDLVKSTSYIRKEEKLNNNNEFEFYYNDYNLNTYRHNYSRIEKLYDLYKIELQYANKKENVSNVNGVELDSTEKSDKLIIKFYLVSEWSRKKFDNELSIEKNRKEFITNTENFLFYQNYKINGLNKKLPNAIINSYESSMGEGIAGFIKNINVNFDNDVLWDIEDDKIAPMAVKMQMQFDPIHDIPLGLDYSGRMRAGAYRIGDINKDLFGKSSTDTFTVESENTENSGINEVIKYKNK